MRAIALSCMIGFIAMSAFASETVEIPLPDLIGTYGSEDPLSECYTMRSAHFLFDRIPDTIYAVWIRISGTVVAGQTYCDFSGWPPPGIQMEGMCFTVNMYDSLSSATLGAGYSTPNENSAFECQLSFYPVSEATWEYLEAGRGDVRLSGSGYCNPFVECYAITCAVAIVSEAVLVVEADFAVSTENESWGVIKSLYR